MSGDDAVVVPLAADKAATFDPWYAEHLRAVVALAYSLTGSRAAAEDVAQDAFAAAFRRWSTVGSYEDPGAWVRRVAVNRAVSRHRRSVTEAKALLRLAGRREEPSTMPAHDETFWREVRALPTRQAQAVALRYLEDRSVTDIARILDCAEATVRVHLHRGRLALAERLGLDQEEER